MSVATLTLQLLSRVQFSSPHKDRLLLTLTIPKTVITSLSSSIPSLINYIMCSVSIEVLCIIMYVSFYVPHDNVAYRSQSENSRFLEITGRLFHINILRPESLFSIFRVIPVLLSQIQTYEVGITSFIYQCKPIWVFRKHLYVGQFPPAKNEQHAHIHRAGLHSAISVT